MIIGIAGQMESGKSEVAKILEKNNGYHNLAFADFLKEMCLKVFSLDPDSVYTTEGKAKEFGLPIRMTKEHCEAMLKEVGRLGLWEISQEHIDKLDTFIGTDFSTPREVLQIVGTEICRHIFSPDFHAKVLFHRIKTQGLENVAISDARFFNERAIIKENEGLNVLVRCAGQSGPTSGHASETNLGQPEDYDFVLFNDKDKGLDYLETIVTQMYEILKAKQ